MVLEFVACLGIPGQKHSDLNFTPGGLSISCIDQSTVCALRLASRTSRDVRPATPRPRQHMHKRAQPSGQHVGRTWVCAAQKGSDANGRVLAASRKGASACRPRVRTPQCTCARAYRTNSSACNRVSACNCPVTTCTETHASMRHARQRALLAPAAVGGDSECGEWAQRQRPEWTWRRLRDRTVNETEAEMPECAGRTGTHAAGAGSCCPLARFSTPASATQKCTSSSVWNCCRMAGDAAWSARTRASCSGWSRSRRAMPRASPVTCAAQDAATAACAPQVLRKQMRGELQARAACLGRAISPLRCAGAGRLL